jgi:hypothetical protein
MKDLKIKFKLPFAEGFESMINKMLAEKIAQDDDDKLLLAALVEVKERLMKKTLLVQDDYSMRLTAVQAIAMRILYTDYVNEFTSYMGNKLMMISNDVKQKYES